MKKTAIAVLSVLFVLVGCAKPPQAAVDAGHSSLQKAEGAQAAQYAGEELAAAEDALKAAEQELQAQKQKFALIRSYKQSEQLLATATEKAQAAEAAAVAGKKQAADDANAAATEARDAVDQARQQLGALAQCPKKPKGFSADLEVMQGSVDALAAQLPAIDAAIAKEDYFGAKAQAETLAEQAAPVLADLEAAKVRFKC